MPKNLEDRSPELLRRQLAMNRQTWQRLQDLGVSDATRIRLDFMYRAPHESAAGELVKLIQTETDYDVQLLREGASLEQYSVAGKTQATAVSQSVLDQWVEWMVAAGLKCGCEFDGWGTEI